MSVVLSDLNVIASTLNNLGQGAGYITKISVQQSLKKILNDLYSELNSQASHAIVEKAHIDGLRATLDDFIVSHLSCFVNDDEKSAVPLNLEISLANTQITIKDPSVKPFRIRLNDCVIEQTVDDEEES
ncbi:unnamed protein product [Gongylonema pulchrum]|uniref:Type III secretion system protein n=1 Tax=Gongylonema pulchrum TaxID=637853 RepID=A0A183CZR4_9BILA|nr:unnamed protein product [Gongylonema pulchrum]